MAMRDPDDSRSYTMGPAGGRRRPRLGATRDIILPRRGGPRPVGTRNVPDRFRFGMRFSFVFTCHGSLDTEEELGNKRGATELTAGMSMATQSTGQDCVGEI